MPALLALLEWWCCGFWDAHSALVLPYAHRLRLLPAYLQQLSMESLGKSVDRDGHPLQQHSGAVIWGEPGTNSQHSFMQLLHQGTRLIPVDFIAVLEPELDEFGQHEQLFANCLSQSRVLMTGKTAAQALQELLDAGVDAAEAHTLAPHKAHPGNRPSSTIVLRALTPERLGALTALYEHKVHAQSVLWNINAFDQWGVEFGKLSANAILDGLRGGATTGLDASTLHLMRRFTAANKDRT
jgi:glucose-6-phosphate isomerase